MCHGSQGSAPSQFLLYIAVRMNVPKCMLLCCAKSLQRCPTFWDSMDCSLPGSFAHGVFQVRILEWVATPSFRDLPIDITKRLRTTQHSIESRASVDTSLKSVSHQFPKLDIFTHFEVLQKFKIYTIPGVIFFCVNMSSSKSRSWPDFLKHYDAFTNVHCNFS